MKTLSKIILVCLLVALVVTAGYSTGRSKTIPFLPGVQGRASSTYANSEVDTIVFTRDPSASAQGIELYYFDSVKIDYMRVYRIVNGAYLALQAGDTLYSNKAGTTVTWIPTLTNTANPANGLPLVVTLSPYADQYAIEIGYNASNNGVSKNTVTAIETKIFSRR